MSVDWNAIRDDFPTLKETLPSGDSVIYLDNGATSQKPAVVIDAIAHYYESQNANVHRGMHHLAELATNAYEGARQLVADFIGAEDTHSIIFTKGTTESINLVAHGWGNAFLEAGDVVVITQMEHHSNIVPWHMLATRKGVVVKYVPVLDDGTLDLAVLDQLLADGVKLITLTHSSNVLGTVNPIAEIIKKAHAAGALVLIDSAQGIPHLPMDVVELDADFVAFSGHKMCGPTGIGVLYGKKALLEAMDPFMGGGEMIAKVTMDESTWADLPYKFEAGTPNIAGGVGLGAAVEYLSDLGMPAIHQHLAELTDYTLNALRAIPGVRIWGDATERGGAISFSLEDLHPHDVSQVLNETGVAIRAGHLCCQPLMEALGVTAVCRASLYFYNTTEDVDALVKALHTTRKIFGYGS